MPFGLCNAPATFMHFLNDVLRPFIYSFFIFYLDDILIFSATWQEHISHLKHVLHTLNKEQLIANLNKCELKKSTWSTLDM